MQIIKAGIEQVADIAPLFDRYRQFYECPADLELATRYIGERLANNESTIFLARDGQQSLGFVQLYRTFCSVQAVPILVLYDLFVEQSVRNSGLGAQLMNRAKEYAQQQGVGRIDLQTAHSNLAGQHLYEKLGYVKVLEDFHTYSLAL